MTPAYTRLQVDERRRQLLERGRDLFARHGYEGLSMAAIAREAGISKPLLYHYFPSKRDYFVATLEEAATELAARTEPDPSLPPLEQLTRSLDAFLSYIDENADAYRRLMRSATSVAEVHELVEQVRERTAARILDALYRADDPPPKTRAAVRAWFWFMDGAIIDWLGHRDIDRTELRDLLLGTLAGALAAAGDSATKLA